MTPTPTPGPHRRTRANWLRPLNQATYRTLQILLASLMALLLIPVSLQIFSRYIGLIPRYIWTEEVARFCLVWIIMLGAMIAVRDGTHFDVDVLPKSRTPAGRLAARMVVHVAIGLVALTFLWFGYAFALFGFDQESELTGLNMITLHIAWPVAGLVMLLFVTERALDDLAEYRRTAPAVHLA